jgi:hypothetical protein
MELFRTTLRQNEPSGAYANPPEVALTVCDPGAAPVPAKGETAAVLLSIYNGETFLPAQLDSFLAQSHPDWVLYWRDDGSADASIRLLRDFGTDLGPARCIFSAGGGRHHVSRSFFALLAAAHAGRASTFAFADQDDVWLPQKLARGVAALAAVPPERPALYCARRILVDSKLRRTGEPGPLRRPPSFPAALTQNVAPGCTMMLNRPAADLILATEPPETVWHDWWSYVVVAAAGGSIIADNAATVLYRQHGANHIGEVRGKLRRGLAALRRGPAPFMRLLREHVATLESKPHLIPLEARQQLDIIARGLHGGFGDRLRALRLPGFRRQTWLETLLFRIWFMIG